MSVLLRVVLPTLTLALGMTALAADIPQLDPSKGSEIGLIYESYLSPWQEGGEESETPARPCDPAARRPPPQVLAGPRIKRIERVFPIEALFVSRSEMRGPVATTDRQGDADLRRGEAALLPRPASAALPRPTRTPRPERSSPSRPARRA